MKAKRTTDSTLTYRQQFSQLSLRRKLSIIISLVSFAVASLSMLSSFFIELSLFRTRLLEEHEASIRMLASNLETTVTFGDELDARELLEALRERESVVVAGVYLADGTLLSTYHRDPAHSHLEPPPPNSGSALSGSALVVNEPIRKDGRYLGNVTMMADLGEVSTFLANRIWILAGLICFSIILATALASRIARALSRPTLELAETAQRISRDNDFSTRHKRITNDETGKLVDAFNEMMERIQQREEQILREKERAEESSRAKDDFLSVISHELRTPLNPIIGYVEILLRKLSDAEDKKQLALVKQYAEHLQSLIDDVIDYSRFERGVVALNKSPVDYRKLCDNAIKLLHQNAKAKDIDLTCSHEISDSSLDGRTTLSCDRVKLQQIVLNLIANSIKFTDRGSVSLTTYLYYTSTHEPMLRIEIKDTGIGISESDRDKVFKPFSQIDESLTRQYSGMGLGLAITRRIVLAMDGRIDFDSRKGKGSTFWLEIPVELSEEAEPDFSEVEAREEGAKGRVLLVDDQLVNLELGESLLTSSGLEVVCARNGAEAIEKAKHEVFRLIIMDIKMPRMSGYEAARAIRCLENENCRTPIVAMTAHVTTRGNEQCFEAGMDDFMSKPFTTAKLNLIVRKWLNPGSSGIDHA